MADEPAVETTPQEGAPAETPQDDWTFTAEDATRGGEETQQTPGSETNPNTETGDEEYAPEWGEESTVPEGMRADLASIAKEMGVPVSNAAQLFERGVQAYKAHMNAQMKEAGAQLRADWGKEFEARCNADKSLMARLAAKAGMTPEQCAPMMSPMGFRFVDAVRQMMGEGSKFAGAATQTQRLTPQAELDAIYESPEKFAILSNPAHPDFEALNKRVNELMGIG